MSASKRIAGMMGAVVSVTLAAATLAPSAHAAGPLENWQVGTLAFGGVAYGSSPWAPPPSADRIAGLHDDKMRFGGAALSGFGIDALARPWAGAMSGVDGELQGMSGVLIDVPFGAFVFTPSIGAGVVAQGALDNEPAVALRSQVELGYEFENRSRFTLGYTRTTSLGVSESRSADNVFGLYYHLPIGAVTGALGDAMTGR